jgi:ATP/maltotriose-dependent transcriptional regulator MalT
MGAASPERADRAGRLTMAARTVARNSQKELDGWLIVERLLEDLVLLRDRVWLVADDLHELHSSEALRQFELLLMRALRSFGSCCRCVMTCVSGCTGYGWRES